MTIPLSEGQLSELDARLAQAQPWDRELLLPGASPRELEAIFGPTDVNLPSEAYTWWSWRTAPSDPPVPKIGSFFALSPANAVSEYRSLVEIYDEGAESENDRWPIELMPFLKDVGGAVLCFTCTGAELPPITSLSHHVRENPRPTAPSLGTVVSWWIEAFESGIYISESEQERVLTDHLRLPPERKLFV